MSRKEPWQVFDDELRREIGRHEDVDVGPDGPVRKMAESDVFEISNAVADSVARHLIEREGLDQEEAVAVLKLFIAELGRPSEVPLRERLRKVWRDWADL